MALDFAAGCVGGLAGVVVGYPLDTIKVHLQTQDVKNPRYKGTWHCFTTIVKKESTFGLYKGMTSPLAGVAMVNAITFGVYGSVNRFLPSHWDSLANVTIAGASAGLVQSVVSCPMELAKTRMQLQDDQLATRSTSSKTMATNNALTTPGQRFKSPLEFLLQVQRTQGVRGVFRGFGITVAREVPGFGLYFLSYEVISNFLSRTCGDKNGQMGAFPIMMAGGLSGVVSWVIAYPIDIVKSRVQADGFTGPRRYQGAKDCFVKSYREEGWRTFTRGLNSTIIRAFPTNAATFLAVTMTFKLLGATNEPHHENKSNQSHRVVVIEIKDKTFEELHHLQAQQQQTRIMLVRDIVNKREDVKKMAEMSQLATFAEATFW